MPQVNDALSPCYWWPAVAFVMRSPAGASNSPLLGPEIGDDGTERLFDQRDGFGISGKQRQDFTAQFFIRAASLRHKGRALYRRRGQRLLEKPIDLLPTLWRHSRRP
jgi:hypothetical protein